MTSGGLPPFFFSGPEGQSIRSSGFVLFPGDKAPKAFRWPKPLVSRGEKVQDTWSGRLSPPLRKDLPVKGPCVMGPDGSA